ncbi:MAG: HEAT repeat domain-containing protein [Candidatus Riflebacteria bacterium]|nr:HEAT repeat domain-containing protein [Candidatus Riflebacteria bacterium]
MEDSVKSFLNSPHEQDRKKAIGLLSRNPDREAVIALQQIAEMDESLEVRFYARKALAVVKNIRRPKTDDVALMLIPEVLDTETFLRFDEDEKCSLVQALIDQNRSDSLQCFLTLVQTEQNSRILAAMVMAIGAFGTAAESNVLIPFLGHQDARVRANAIEALELLGNLKLFAYIFPLLEDPDNRVRANAARSLRSIEPFTSFRLLQAMISSGKIPFQASAIFVLRCFESDASAALVAPFLDSPHKELRQRAEQTLRVLAERGVSRAIELIGDYQPGDEPTSPESILQELGSQPVSVQESGDRLEQAFAISDPRKRFETIEKECVQLGEKAIDPLIAHIPHELDHLVIGKIFILLGRLHATKATKCLLTGLRHQDDRCRANAVEAIGMIGEPDSLIHLISMLQDTHNRVRGNTILALRDVPGVDIQSPLQQLAESSEEIYQRTAVYVLAELQRAEFFPLLLKLSHASFSEVRKNALIAISALEKAGHHFQKLQPAAEPSPAVPIGSTISDQTTNLTEKSFERNTPVSTRKSSLLNSPESKPLAYSRANLPTGDSKVKESSIPSSWSFVLMISLLICFVGLFLIDSKYNEYRSSNQKCLDKMREQIEKIDSADSKLKAVIKVVKVSADGLKQVQDSFEKMAQMLQNGVDNGSFDASATTSILKKCRPIALEIKNTIAELDKCMEERSLENSPGQAIK